MTICAAAICRTDEEELIIAAADRALTSRDIVFETTQMKFFQLTPWAFALGADDHPSHTTIALETEQKIKSGDQKAEAVRDIAYLYAQSFAALRRRKAEGKYLTPLGLDSESFIARQRTMRPEVVSKLTENLQDEVLPVQTLIIGVDTEGAHIYLIEDPGEAICLDGTAFAAIGSGHRHAESQFMFAGYTRAWPVNRALWLVAWAKKMAEVAPFVGKTATDILVIGRKFIMRVNTKDNAKLMDYLNQSMTTLSNQIQACTEDIIKGMPLTNLEGISPSGGPMTLNAASSS